MLSHFPEPRPVGICLRPKCRASLDGKRRHALTCSPGCRKAFSRALARARANPETSWAAARALAWGLEIRDFWRTPPAVFEALAAMYGPFHLDAAATAEDTLAPRFLTPEDDALSVSWVEASGQLQPRIWCNPPYSRKGGRGDGLLAWVQAAIRARDEGALVVLLVQAAHATEWARLAKAEAAERVEPDKRIQFLNPDPTGPRGSNRHESLIFVFKPGERGPAVPRDLELSCC